MIRSFLYRWTYTIMAVVLVAVAITLMIIQRA